MSSSSRTDTYRPAATSRPTLSGRTRCGSATVWRWTAIAERRIERRHRPLDPSPRLVVTGVHDQANFEVVVVLRGQRRQRVDQRRTRAHGAGDHREEGSWCHQYENLAGP